MNDQRRGWWCRVPGVALIGLGLGGLTGGVGLAEDGPPSLEGPAASGDLLPDAPPGDGRGRSADGAAHEAFLAPGTAPGRVAAPKSPPPPIVERPTEDRPGDQAVWVAGYWTWDPARADFAWVAGAWRVAPPEKIWVNGRWQRDAQGWSRVPGFWSPRRVPAGVASPALSANPTPVLNPAPDRSDPGAAAGDWRATGPPAAQPADEPGDPPSPDAFFVPGYHTPEGDRVVWKPGFWARTQPGWEWVPARWVRRPNGWDYREGSWAREPASAPASPPEGPAVSQTVARPPAEGRALPPAIVESEPARPDTSAAPAPRRSESDDVPISGPEDEARVGDREMRPPVVVVPYGYRPPYPYGYPNPYAPPRGYYGPGSARANIPFGVIPPFARRILNRVLP